MQNFKKNVLGLAVVSTLIGLSACGGGGSGSGTASTQSASANGRFVDAAVQGLNYVTSSGVSGLTDANGTYAYNTGDTVVFSIGGVSLPSVAARGLVTPLVYDANNPTVSSKTVLNIARFLQGLDSDDNPDNGITLDSTRLKPNVSTPDFTDAGLNFENVFNNIDDVPNESKAASHLSNTVAAENGAPKVTKLTTITPAVGNEGIAEILAFHKATNTMFYTVDIAQTPNSFRQATLDGTVLGDVNVANDVNDANFTAGGVQSLDVTGNLLAIAVQASPNKTDPGVIAFYRLDTNTSAPSHTFLKKVTVGALPDGVAFSPDGSKLVVANEAEPDVGITVDPEGSISIIDISNNTPADNALTLGFTDFNASGSRASELPSGYRKALQGATVAQDIEPEFVAITDDSSKAIVTLQENNALAIVSLTGTPSILSIVSAGYSDYANNELAPSDRAEDLKGNPRVGAPELKGLPNLFGTRMPDGIAAFNVGGTDYVIYANEGDDRDDFLPADETAKIKDITLDSTAFPNATALQADKEFGRLNVLAKTGNGGANGLFGDTDQDGAYEKLYMLGSRSFTIQSMANPGADVFDSKSELELTLYGEIEALFDRKDTTANVGSPEALLQEAMFGAVNGRLDNKGPEPESVAVGTINNKLYAFIGLERTSTVAMYDISNPASPVFVDHIYNLTTDANGALAGDISPEALKFVAASDSPTGKPLLLVGHEVSGTVSVYEFN